jgi:hypothetical protein
MQDCRTVAGPDMHSTQTVHEPPAAASHVASPADSHPLPCCAVLCCRYHAVNGAVGQQMYREMVQPVIDRFCQGYNGCILAYGQTGVTLLLDALIGSCVASCNPHGMWSVLYVVLYHAMCHVLPCTVQHRAMQIRHCAVRM